MTKEEIIKNFDQHIQNYKDKIVLWKNVEVVTKKDGTEFQNFSRNFTNSSIRNFYSSRYIGVHAWVENRWIEDEIDTRQLLENADTEISEDRIIKKPISKPYYYLTVKETADKINKVIKQYEINIRDYEAQKAIVIDCYDEIENMATEMLNKIKQVTIDTNKEYISAYYRLRDVVKERF